MFRASGIVTVLQEARFQLVRDDGTARLFVLAGDAALEMQELTELHQRACRIVVDYRKADDLIAAVATRIAIADQHDKERCH